jgi:sterol desaturase/sphingolipid hydroxylase (fatty acid hydroxylase superfamily)
MRYEDVETAFLIIFSLAFFFLERKWPKHQTLDQKSFLKEDILAFGILVVGINVFRPLVIKIFDLMNFKDFLFLEGILDLPVLIKLLILHIISDFFLYWIHRGMHSFHFLWKTHQWHHSAESLYWFSGFRTSLMHVFLYAFPQILAGFYLFHLTSIELGIGFGLGVISNLFTHSNLKLPPWLPLHYFLVTPDYHHPHHSQMGTQNKNFGNVFTIWDRAFGTYVDPNLIKKDFKYGLKEKPKNWRMMIGL